MSVTKSTIVISPQADGTASATQSIVIPVGTKAVLIWGFADATSASMPYASIVTVGGDDADFVGKTSTTPEGRAIWLYAFTNFGSLPVTSTIEFNVPISTSKLIAALALGSTSDSELIIEANVGTSGYGTRQRSLVEGTFNGGKMFTALALLMAGPANVSEISGPQSVLWETSYGAGPQNYATVNEVTVDTGIYSVSTEANWVTDAAYVWSELGCSVREKTKLSTYLENGGIKKAIIDLNATIATNQNALMTAVSSYGSFISNKLTGNSELTGDLHIDGWLIGETKPLAQFMDSYIGTGTTLAVNRQRPYPVDTVSNSYLQTKLTAGYNTNSIRYGIVSTGTSDITIISIGKRTAVSSPVMIAVGITGGGIGLFKSTDGVTFNAVYSTGTSTNLGTPVNNPNNPNIWVVPILGTAQVLRSSDDGATFSVITVTKVGGGTLSFSTSVYNLQSSLGGSPIVSDWNSAGFLYSSLFGTVWHSADGITWTAGPVDMLVGVGQFLGFYFGEGSVMMYYYDSTLSQTGFMFSNDGGVSFSQGGMFLNAGTAVSLAEAATNEITYSSVDFSAGLSAWFRSSTVTAGTGTKVLFETMFTGKNPGITGSALTVVNPTRDQYVKFHASDCFSIDANFFPVAGRKLLINTFRFTLMDLFYYASGLRRRAFCQNVLTADIGAILQSTYPNIDPDDFKVIQMSGSIISHTASAVINPSLWQYAMFLRSTDMGTNSMVVLPPLTQGLAGESSLYTRVS